MSIFEYVLFGLAFICILAIGVCLILIKINEIKIAKLLIKEMKQFEEGEEE